MMATCQRIRDRLGEAGPAALRDDADARQHVETCPECFALLEAMAQLERGLASLPAHDASDAAVERLLARVAAEPAPEPRRETREERRTWLGLVLPTARQVAGLAAAGAVAVVALFVIAVPSLRRARVPGAPPAAYYSPIDEQATPASPARPGFRPSPSPPTTFPQSARDRLAAAADGKAEASPRLEQSKRQVGAAQDADALLEREVAEQALSEDAPERTKDGRVASNERASSAPPSPGVAGGLGGGLRSDAPAPPDAPGFADDAVEVAEELRLEGDLTTDPLEKSVPAGTLRLEGDRAPEPVERVEPRFPPDAVAAGLEVHVGVALRVGPDGAVTDVRATEATVLGDWPGGSAPLLRAVEDAVRRWRYAPVVVDGRPVPFATTLDLRFDLRGGSASPPPTPPPPTGAADAFLHERERTRDLAFQAASGYWANTWVPGDPVLRLLQLRLAGAAPFTGHDGRALALHAAAEAPRRPFDAPRGAAVGLFVQADHAALDGEQRLLVEVGLQATPDAGGRRPALDLALLLDLRGTLSLEDAARLRALALDFARARESGDRLRLVVAGRGPLADVEPEAFRYGALAVVLDRLLADATAGAGDPDDLPAALARAIAAVAEPAPGAEAAVVVATTGALAPLAPLTALAHRGAVSAAVATSVVGVGERVVPHELDRLALAGQGERRLLERREEAEALVARQLAGTGRAVARALRLRIRLAPGVRLVDVVGSERLDAGRADRVREAERSLDQRLARDLGIAEDRGDDEDGIQIVIPSFAPGATHSVLLDVVASGPGAIADVTLRYKDVAFRRNGIARASLMLPRGRRAPGALENGVVALLLARRLEADLEAAGDAVQGGDVAGARRRLENAVELRAGLSARRPALAADPGLRADLAMLREYASALALPLAPAQWQDLSRSLRYAARLKRLPRPAPLAGAH